MLWSRVVRKERRQTELKHEATDKAKQTEDLKLTCLGKINFPSCCPQWVRISSCSLLLGTDDRSPTQNSLTGQRGVSEGWWEMTPWTQRL